MLSLGYSWGLRLVGAISQRKHMRTLLLCLVLVGVLAVACGSTADPTTAPVVPADNPTNAPEPTVVSPPAPTLTATSAPTATALPTPTPAPSAVSAPEAEAVAREWVSANLPQIRSEIGIAIASKADTLPSISVEFQKTVLESSKQWKSGQADTEINWTGVSVDFKEGGKWTVRLDAETVTDVEHEGTSGQLKATTPFLINGSGTRVENYEVLLDEVELTLAGMQVKAELDKQLLDSEQASSALESLPDLPSSPLGN